MGVLGNRINVWGKKEDFYYKKGDFFYNNSESLPGSRYNVWKDNIVISTCGSIFTADTKK